MSSPLRIIDANANRAREALRVMEDAARFLLDNQALCARLKSARHALAAALGHLPGGDCGIAWRDTAADVGTGVSTVSESRREDVRAVVVAAGKRLSEALRSIEEFAKLVDTSGRVAPAIERVRYLGYDLERDLVLAFGSSRPRPRWKLCVVLTESLCAHVPWLETARMAVDAGADCIQLREKSLEGGELLRRARSLVEVCSGAAVIINDRPDIAVLSGAAGVHLGQGDLSVADARKLVGTDLLIGVSTESLDRARAAMGAGADYCGVGPMFPTATKVKPRVAGPSYLKEYLSHEPHLPPCLAIGGIGPGQMAELAAAGAPAMLGERWGVAVSSAVCRSQDPAAACRAILNAVRPLPIG